MNTTALLISLASSWPGWAQGAQPAVPGGTSAAAFLGQALPTPVERTTRAYQRWQDQITLPYANQLGMFNGRGVRVGVADTGADVAHVELAGQIGASYSAFDVSARVADAQGHGTAVAGLIAGSTARGAPVSGVAPGASLAVAKVFDASGYSADARISAGIHWLVNSARVPIINLSLAGSTPSNPAPLRNGVNQGVLFTIAAGNDGRASVSWPARYASAGWANGQIIVVGAVDANNRLARFSNYGAETAAWFVVAPGVNVTTSYLNGQYASLSGTSMAAPQVAGQAALIKSAWQFLGASQISQIIFKSATRLGSATDSRPDPVYGWGLINVAKSLGPIGSVLTPVGARQFTLSGAVMLSGTGSIGTTALGITAVDQFGRGFSVDVAKNIQSAAPAHSTARMLFDGIEHQDGLVEKVQGQQSLAVGADGRLAWSNRLASGATVGFGAGSMSDHFFGLSAAKLAPWSVSGKAKFNAPYFTMVHEARHSGFSIPFGQGGQLRVGVLREADERDALVQTMAAGAHRSLSSAELEQRFGPVLAIVNVGVLREHGSLLGSQQSEALALNAPSRTAFASVSAAYSLTPTMALVGMASVGRTAGFSNTNSLVSNVSSVKTVSASVGWSARGVWDKADRFGLSWSMPAKVTQGALSLTGALAQDDNGVLSDGTRLLNLRPSATEHDLEMSYTRPLGRQGKLSGGLMLRLHPGHDVAAPKDVLMGVRYARAF